jgi:DegV family protein with EDD domain
MSVRIVTDSTCDLPQNVVQEMGITVVPLHIHVGEKDYIDGIDMTRDEFYQRLPSMEPHPTTAVPSTEKFIATYKKLVENGAKEILSIHLSETLSAVVNVARAAALEIKSIPVTVMDSRQLSLGTGFLAHTASTLASKGMPVKEMIPFLEDQIKRTYVAAGLSTLKFLRLSGRMNATISRVGELLQIKPIMKMHDGVAGVERVRTYRKVVNRLAEMIQSFGELEKIAFLHSGVQQSMEALREKVFKSLPEGDIWEETINPVLGVHIGPGVVGFACISKN